MQRARKQALREEIVARDGSLCLWCSCSLPVDHPGATLDHVRPQSRGGSWSVTNLVLACRSCNTARGNKDALEWAAICRDAGKVIHVAALVPAITRADDDLADHHYFMIAHCERASEQRAASIIRKSRRRRVHAAMLEEHRYLRELRERRKAYERDASRFSATRAPDGARA